MDIQIKLFATLRDRAGANQVEVDLPDDATVSLVCSDADMPQR